MKIPGLFKLQTGQSLVEVVVATAVIILLATGIISGTTAALKANLSARARSEATKLVQEGLESARHQRDSGWSDFRAKAVTDDISYYYCMPSGTSFVPISPNQDPGGNTSLCAGNVTISVGTGTIVYRRYASFLWDSANNRMVVNVYVRWIDSGTERNSHASTFLTQWR